MNIIKDKKKMKRILVKAIKIGLGSSLAILLASFLELQYQIFAGTITLLTILTTRWETIRLSFYRVITFFISVAVCWLVFSHLGGGWLEYGLFVFIIIIINELMGWSATLSVNAVIGAHFFTEMDFSLRFIANEFALVLIGIVIAVILSFFNNNKGSEKQILKDMKYVEDNLQGILTHLSAYLRKEELPHSVWDDINSLEDKLKEFIQDAIEYNNNSFSDHPTYYVDYFEMRLLQVDMLRSLHEEMQRMRSMPVQADVVADYLDFMNACLGKMDSLEMQIEKLHEILKHLKEDHLPQDMEEFQSRAILYHVLMDIEDFLYIKRRFVEGLDEKYRRETFIKTMD
ncbi:MAG: hypothetical protein IJZ82_08790 [Lachnospiraceae bacterium]|nr:hypothetical protein [Lachnospiraceae bacterium]